MPLEESSLGRIHQARYHVLRIIHRHSVDHEVHSILTPHFTLLTPRKKIVYPLEIPVHENTCIALKNICLQLLFQCATLRQMHGSHHHETGAFRVLQCFLDYIFCGVFLHFLTAHGRIRAPYAREEQTEILVYLRRGAHRASRIARDHFLLDGDGGRYAAYEVTLGFVHPAQELSGIARQRLHITALAFGIQCVEGQR